MNGDSAVIAWAALAAFIVGYVVGYDLWAHYTGHLSMSAQVSRWLKETWAGPVFVGLWVAIPVGLFYHFAQKLWP